MGRRLLTAILCAIAATVGAEQPLPFSDPTNKRIPVKTHCLAPPYLDSDLQSRWFDFGGDAIVRADKYVRLTSDMASRSGWLFSKIPITVTNWEIEIEFKIHGRSNLHGDGMAMWITKQRATQGPVFGSTDNFEGLGIFFDTYKNNRPGVVFPMVMAMVGNGQMSYNKDDDGKEHELASCSARGIRDASIPTKARVTYYQDKFLRVELQYKSEGEWLECFETGPVTLPTVSYLGFSAETGELSDNFDILRVDMNQLVGLPETAGSGDHAANQHAGSNTARPRVSRVPKASSGKPGWGWRFVQVLLFILAVGGGYVGWTLYRTQRRGSRFD